MLSENIDDLLSLLALMVFADTRVIEDEISAFVRLADKLQIARSMDPKLSEARLAIWFETNREQVQSAFEEDGFEAWLYERLDRLKPLPDKISILAVLCDIASSDGEVHVSEKALIKLTADRWGIVI